MALPELGATIWVRPAVPNVEHHPGSGRFLAAPTLVVVTEHIFCRLRDGALIQIPAPPDPPAGAKEK